MVQIWENYKVKLKDEKVFIVLDRERYDYLTEKEVPLLKRMRSVYWEAESVAMKHGYGKAKIEKIWYCGVWYHFLYTDNLLGVTNLN